MTTLTASGLALSAPVGVLRRLLEVPARLAPARSSLPVLSCVRLVAFRGALSVEGGDLELRARSEAPMLCDQDGDVCVPAGTLSEMLAQLSGDVALSVESGMLVLRSGRAVYRARVAKPDAVAGWPSWTDLPGGVQVDAAEFGGLAGSVLDAASSDDSRPVLTGVLVGETADGLRLVATDSYRLHVATSESMSLGRAPSAAPLLVPVRALSELARFADGPLVVAFADRQVQFRSAGAALSARVIEGDYPRWEALVPKSQPTVVRCRSVALADAVRRVRVAAESSSGKDGPSCRVVRVTFAPGEGVSLSGVRDTAEAVDGCDAVVEGPAVAVAFNSAYLLDALARAGDDLVLGLSDSRNPVTVRRAGDEAAWVALLMPVRVS